MKRFEGVAAGIVAVVVILVASGFRATPYNNYVLLADAFRHGRVWIDWPGAYIDALAFAGKHFVIEAPLPAMLLVPAVAIWGTGVNQTVLAALLGGVATFAAYDIAQRLGVARRTAIALVAFLLLGTDLFWCAMLGDVWFLAHVASVAATLLALREVLGERRGALVALYAACAVESRFTMVLALPVYAAWLWWGTGTRDAREDDRRTRSRRLARFAFALVPFASLWVAYNLARWGVPYDIGYTTWYHADAVGSPDGSPFRLRYLPEEAYSFFVRYPEYRASFPYLIPSLAGVALTWTSPALALAAFARRPRKLVVGCLVATVLCAAPNFVYYVNGFAQFGMRHALDFEPFLFVLMAVAARSGLQRFAIPLIGWSIVVGTWGCWYWRTFVRA
ncbi:MAG: hypothetical protein NVSMB59_07430 [Vulcanimicrobiaceae bacterium]